MTKEKISKKYYNRHQKRGCAIILVPLLALPLYSDEIKFQFKSPSFSGVGTSAHYLTIDQQEYTRREALEAEIQALKEEAERDADSTTLARFLRNFESRIYAQLSKQLVDSMFGEDSGTEGSVTFEGTTISYLKDSENVTLTIVDPNGSQTVITVPIGDFTF